MFVYITFSLGQINKCQVSMFIIESKITLGLGGVMICNVTIPLQATPQLIQVLLNLRLNRSPRNESIFFCILGLKVFILQLTPLGGHLVDGSPKV